MTLPVPAAAVELRELSKRFGAFKAVDRLSLSVSEGEIFGFLGATAPASRPRSG